MIACTNLPPLGDSLSEYSASQKKAALQAEEDKRLASALSLWQSQLPLSADDTEVREAIARLQKKILAQGNHAIRKGKAAYAAGNDRTGDTWMLKVLALQPSNKEALAALRSSTSQQAQAQQSAKLLDKTSIKPYHANVKAEINVAQLQESFDAGNFEEVISQGLNTETKLTGADTLILRSSYLAIAERAAYQGNRLLELENLQRASSLLLTTDDSVSDRIAALRVELSEDWYRKGSGMIQSDLSSAIFALEKSIDYNPENTVAKLKLKQAKTLQRNLVKIKDR